MNWQINELKAYEWYKENYDNDAISAGGSNSTVADIYSPKINGYIEIKTLDPSAFGGQFTASTAVYDVCKDVMNGELTSENAIIFSKAHYQDKQVKGFIVVSDIIEYYDYDRFFETFQFSWQKRGKKSGSSTAAKKYWSQLGELIPEGVKEVNGTLYVNNEDQIGQYFWIDNNQFFISKISAGEVRRCSHTQNETWLVVITNNER